MMYLGIDTSNYTTSVCTYDGDIIDSRTRLIPVKEGERGIRQSDGVFEHLKALPNLYDELLVKDICAVGVSARPRNVKDSYMPVFLVGEGYARVIAKTLNVPLYTFSHQDGHIAAGILSGDNKELFNGEFLSVHISGGTTEILKCEYKKPGFSIDIIGGTRDISAGQLIDRAGVYMGFKFPSGKELETFAKKSTKELKMPVSTDGSWMNFSGTENKVKGYLETESKADISRAVLLAVAKTLVKTINSAISEYGIKRVLIVGGVASNELIREMLKAQLFGEVFFAEPRYSTDNALGIAYLTYINEKGEY